MAKDIEFNEIETMFLGISESLNSVNIVEIDEHRKDFFSDQYTGDPNGLFQFKSCIEATNALFMCFYECLYIFQQFSSDVNHSTTITMKSLFKIKEYSIKKQMKPIMESIRDYENHSTTITSVKNRYKDKQNLFIKYTEDINQNPNQSAKKQYRLRFNQIKSLRNELKDTRISVINYSQKSLDNYNKYIHDISLHIKRYNITTTNFLKNFHRLYSNIYKKLSQTGEFFRDKANQIDFKKDFKAYVALNQIARYEFFDKGFEVFDTQSPAFDGISHNHIPKEITPVYPIGISRIIKDYFASGENETNCIKGKGTFIMESPDDNDWCYIMNPVTMISGFVPSMCLEQVSHMFGIVLRDYDVDVNNGIQFHDIPVQKGDFLSIINDSNNIFYGVENVFGKRFNMPKSHVGIIYNKKI